MEQEVLQIAQYVTGTAIDHHFLLAFCQVVHHRTFRIQFGAVLVEVGHFKLGAAMYATAVGLQLAKHQLQQGRLATAVRTDQGNLVAALHLSGEIAHQHFAADLIVDIFHLEHNLAGAYRFFNLHFGGAHHFTTF
ncbi:hypothetical protein D3C80_1488870 [compost metagenome]